MIKTTNIPSSARVKQCFKKINFSDSYCFSLSNTNKNIEEIYIDTFSYNPKWVKFLLQLRNRIVSVFGLKTDASPMEYHKLEEGKKAGIFNIYHIYPDEIIAGEDDKHLNFRVSLFKENENIYVSTLVEYNNTFGRYYMSIIKPFHKLVVKSMINNAIKKNNPAISQPTI